MSSVTTPKKGTEAPQMSIPVMALTTLGVVIAVLGIFAAGSMLMVSIGLGAIVAAGLIELGGRLIGRGRDE